MAPEILRNEEHDEKSDIYSLGLICWQMITNEILPYKEFNRGINIFIEKISEERVRPSIQRVPICFRDLLDRLWHHDPYLRPMAGEIEDLLFDRLVDFEIPFELGRNFWKQKKGKRQVSSDEILYNFGSLMLSQEYKLNELNCLKELLSVDGKISIEQFSRMFKWFGSSPTVIHNALNLCSKDWFHGNITREEGDRLLTFCNNKFLVRMTLSETNPKLPPKDITTHPFSFSFKTNDKVCHKRLLFVPSIQKFKTDNCDCEYDTIFELVEAEALEQNLYPLAGSRYKTILDSNYKRDMGYLHNTSVIRTLEIEDKSRKKDLNYT